MKNKRKLKITSRIFSLEAENATVKEIVIIVIIVLMIFGLCCLYSLKFAEIIVN